MSRHKYMPSAIMVEGSLSRQHDELMSELAYIDQFPERFESQPARVLRRVAVVQMISEIRRHMATWAMPIELYHHQDSQEVA